MSQHHCQALVITCIDFRFHKQIHRWLKEDLGLEDNYDLLSIAGAGRDLVGENPLLPPEKILNEIALSHQLHHIKRVIILHHQNCGAYGTELESGSAAELERHRHDTAAEQKLIQQHLPGVQVERYFIKLNGEVIKLD